MVSVAAQQPDNVGNFMKGALKGLVNGAMAMGFFYGGWAVLSMLSLAPAMASGIGLFIGLGIFTSAAISGVLAVQHGTHPHEANHGMIRGAQVVQASQNVAPVMIPGASVAADRAHEAEHAPSRQWAQSVGHRGDRIQEILHNGSLSDKDRASAILREREAQAAAPQSVAL